MTLWTKPIWLQPDWGIVWAGWYEMSSIEKINLLNQVGQLPINPYAWQIQDAVRQSIITIISAETWSWKTTQVPQYLRRLWGKAINISIAEPRVIATVNAARRVSQELMAKEENPYFDIWYRVGYRTWKWSESMPGTELLFVTDWLQLLRQFVSWKNPDILIADEVHNYSVPTEFLLAQSKRLMSLRNLTGRRMRLVLMSATLNIGRIEDFFSDITKEIPVFNIPWRTFPVEKYFKDGTEFIPSIIELAQKQTDKIWEEEYKNILVFVEWKAKIEKTIKYLKEKLPNYEILPLHSELPRAEQELVMIKWSRPRIIVATNIAQESITIPYINAVVDNWFGKILRVNEHWVPELRKECVSVADSMQREGRAWRVMVWEYVRANATKLEKLHLFPDWEIENITIEKFILGALAYWFDPIKELMFAWEKTFVHKPSEILIKMSYDNLRKLGAITMDNKVTRLWKKLLILPLEPYIARMIDEWIKRWCGANMVDICSIINHKWFLTKIDIWKKFVPWKFHQDSDLIAHRELFHFITTREPLDSETLHKLHFYLPDKDKAGLVKKQIEEYKRISNSTKDKMLFEVIDFTNIWVKAKAVNEILSTIVNIKDRLEWIWEELFYSEDFTEISKSILAWMLDNIFVWLKWAKKFKHEVKWEFEKPKTSILLPSNKAFYVWAPFIIGWDNEDTPDLPLLSFITKVEADRIEEIGSPHIDETFSDIEFSNKQIGFTKKWEPKMSPTVKAKRVAKLWGLTISENVWEVPKNKLKSVIFYDWLPDFLVYENRAISNFIQCYNEWEFNIEKFKELLKLVCKNLFPNFDFTKFDSHREWFIDDTNILFYFKDSKDPRIVEFLANPYKTVFKSWEVNLKEDIVAVQNVAETEEDLISLEARLKEEAQAEKKRIQIEKREARIARAKAKDKKEKEDQEAEKTLEPKAETEQGPVKPSKPPLEKKDRTNKLPRRLKKAAQAEKLENERRMWDRRKS